MRRLAFGALLVSLSGLAQSLPMFRGGLEHRGVYPASGLRTAPTVKWKFKTRGKVLSSPAVDGGVVYVGSTGYDLYAIDQETGTQRWKFTTRSAVTSSPAVAGGLVYFTSFDGNLYAVQTSSGELKWKFSTEGERRFSHRRLHGLQPFGEMQPDPWDFWLSSPAVSGGVVYFGGGDGNVYAVDAASGALKWKYPTGDVVHSSPAVVDGLVIVGSWDSFLYALDINTGQPKWRDQAGLDPQVGNQQGFQASPAVAGGMVYVGCRDSNVYALDLKTGEKKWAANNRGSWVLTSPAVFDGKVYFGTSDTSLLREVDGRTGEALTTLKARFPVYSSPAIAGDVLLAGTMDGRLLAFDVKTHQALWEFQTEASKQNSASYSTNGSLDFAKLMTTNFYDDMVVAVAKLYSMGSFLSSPAIANDTIYIGSADGYVYALR